MRKWGGIRFCLSHATRDIHACIIVISPELVRSGDGLLEWPPGARKAWPKVSSALGSLGGYPCTT